MTATIYVDFTLYKWLRDVEVWYKTIYYPKNHRGTMPMMDEHLLIMRRNYDYPNIEGSDVREKRINFLNFCQIQTERSFMRTG